MSDPTKSYIGRASTFDKVHESQVPVSAYRGPLTDSEKTQIIGVSKDVFGIKGTSIRLYRKAMARVYSVLGKLLEKASQHVENKERIHRYLISNHVSKNKKA